MFKLVLTLFLVNGIFLPMADAAELSLTATLNPSTEYNDNVFLNENEQGSFHFAISPTAIISHALENSKTSLSVGYKIDRYSSLSDIDSENPFVRLSTHYQTERSTLGLTASYVENTTRDDADEDTGDFTTQSIVTSESISPSYSYQITERDTLSLSGTYSTREYSTSNFSDNETRSLSSSWQHRFSERLSAGLSAFVSNYQSDGLTLSTDTDSYNLATTFDYALTELWQLNGQIGARRVNSEEEDFLGFKQNNSNTGSSFDVSASRKGERDNLEISVSRSLSPSSSGEVNQQDRLQVNWSRELSETITASLGASYLETTSALDDGSEKRENIRFSPALTWRFDRNLALKLSYHYREQKREQGSDVSSNAVMVSLNYNLDGIRASR